MQRYLSTTNLGLGYRHYSSPVRGNSLADLQTSGFVPVFNAAYNSSATPNLVQPFPTVFGYDQSRLTQTITGYGAFDKGWYSPATGSAPAAFVPGQGYIANLAGTQTVDFVGTLNSGDYVQALARNSGATAADAGWQLVGNSYPAPLDWSLVAPADRPNLDGALYVFESSSQYTGQYRSYVNGMGTSPLIGTGQGFFVRVSAGQTAGSLTFRNTQRLTDYATAQVPMRRGTTDTRPLVQLTLAGNGASDAVYVYVETGATTGFDAAFDAAKLPNSTGLNLSAVAATGEHLAIQGLPVLGTGTTVVPLTLGLPQVGSYALNVSKLANFLPGTQLHLRDQLLGTSTLLTAATRCAFSTTATTIAGRFYLELWPAAGPLATAGQQLGGGLSVYPNPAHKAATVLVPAVPGATSATLVLCDALGRQV